MDLFKVVKLTKPTQVAVGLRQLREGERPILETTAGRLVGVAQEEEEADVSTIPVNATPVQNVAAQEGTSENILRVDTPSSLGPVDVSSDSEEVRLLRKRKVVEDLGESSSKRIRPPVDVEEPVRSGHEGGPQIDMTAGGGAASAEVVKPQVVREHGEPSVGQIIDVLNAASERQAELSAQLKARYADEGRASAQKDVEIADLKAQLAEARREVNFSNEAAKKHAEEKIAVLAALKNKHEEVRRLQSNAREAMKMLEQKRGEHLACLDKFADELKARIAVHESKLRQLSIEYDEELYPHLMSSIAERRWLISYGLRLAAMVVLESQEVTGAFGDVVTAAIAYGKTQAIDELHKAKL